MCTLIPSSFKNPTDHQKVHVLLCIISASFFLKEVNSTHYTHRMLSCSVWKRQKPALVLTQWWAHSLTQCPLNLSLNWQQGRKSAITVAQCLLNVFCWMTFRAAGLGKGKNCFPHCLLSSWPLSAVSTEEVICSSPIPSGPGSQSETEECVLQLPQQCQHLGTNTTALGSRHCCSVSWYPLLEQK